MSAEKPPAFQFYPRDFMADPAVQRLTWDQRGRYVWALCCSALTDTPGQAQESDWAAWMGYDEASWPAHREAHARCFKVTPDGWVQRRLVETRASQEAYARDASAGGRARIAGMDAGMRRDFAKRAAAIRWGKPMPADASGMPAGMPADASTASASASNNIHGSRISTVLHGVPHPSPEGVGAGHPAPPGSPPVVLIPLRDGTTFGITAQQVARWDRTFPDVLVTTTLREMAAWAEANPTRRKTKRGALRFVTGWLLREQAKAERSARDGNQGRR